MNKEEIEDIKDNLRILHQVLWNEYREGTYTIQRILEYINCLEQKESILDKVTDKLKKMKQSINKLKNRDGETMIMVDVCIQNIIAFYNDIEKIIEGEKK